MIGRIRDWLWRERFFNSRFEELRFWLGVYVRFLFVLGVVAFAVVGYLFVNIFGVPGVPGSSHGEDTRSVYISDSDLKAVETVYDKDMEKGFCLYGSYSRYSIQVEDVVYVYNPEVQTEDSIRFDCVEQTKERLPKLLNNDSYYLIGNIHTHPDNARLSRPDAFIFGYLNVFQETFGVYNGERLEFFTSRSLSYGLEKYVED